MAGIGAGAAGGGGLKGRSLTQPVRWEFCREKRQPLRSRAAPSQHAVARTLGFIPTAAMRWKDNHQKKSPSLGQTDGVCQAEPVHRLSQHCSHTAGDVGFPEL